MNHSDVQSRMADYLDGGLGLDQRALVDAHLDACERCATDLSELHSTVSLLRALPAPQTPPDLADNVIAQIRSGAGRSGWQDFADSILSWLTPPRLVMPVTALAAAAGVFVISGGQFASVEAQPLESLARTETAVQPRVVVAESRSTAPSPQRDLSRNLAVARTKPQAAPPTIAQEPPPLLAHAQPPSTVFASNGAFQPSLFGNRQARRVVGSATGGVQALQGAPVQPQARRAESVGRERLLEQRLELLRRDPVQFSAWLGQRSRAERDLWLTQFASHASERGITGPVLRALRGSNDPQLDSAAHQLQQILSENESEVAPLD